MMHFNSLSSTNAVLLEIQKIVRKKDVLEQIYQFTQYRNVAILFSSTNKNGAEQMIWLTNDMLPFHLPNEIANILEDSIDQYNKDISSLNQHLKNL
ncbi:MAG: hypothetical protein EBU61_00095 [Crocinitomicaceae bacterium]|nr:hypothetical protein [Crocinitomicaceae bacterium]